MAICASFTLLPFLGRYQHDKLVIGTADRDRMAAFIPWR